LALATGCSSAPGNEAADASAGGDDGGCVGFCATDAPNNLPIPQQVKNTIDHICANIDGCHGSGAGGMSLVYGDEFTDMIGVPSMENSQLLRVKPFDPENSYVYRKLACEGGIIDSCMPLEAPNPSIAALFHTWIEAGAPTP
jgi:hypothetical protein